jgi:hypothetical protein
MVLRGADRFVVVNCESKEVRRKMRLDRSGAEGHRDVGEMRTILASVATASLLGVVGGVVLFTACPAVASCGK